MKKLVIGCLVVLALIAVGASVATYIVYQKVRSTVADFGEPTKVPAIERSVRNQSSFTPPQSGEFTDSQIQRMLSVHQAVRAKLGERAKEFEQKYKTFLAKKEATALDLPQLVQAYRDLAALYVEAKQTQIDALNSAGFSLDEYRWVRHSAYMAIGMPLTEFDVAQIIDAIRNGKDVQAPVTTMPFGPQGSEKNKALARPHQKALESYAGLAFFGL